LYHENLDLKKKYSFLFQRFYKIICLYKNEIKPMKLITIIMFLLLIACTSKEEIVPNTIIGKWAPTYITQTKQADGTFDAWHTINTLVALPIYEFTSDGRFLRDGKPGETCCSSGNKYSVSGSKINFTELSVCPNVKCALCEYWSIIEIKGDTLILDECFARNKYIKTK
jgi:hypothetical protein